MLKRTGVGNYDNWFTIYEIRAFSVTNLLEGSAVIEAPEAKHSDYRVENLIENQETRSSRQDINPITGWNGEKASAPDRSSQSSCFVTT